MVALPLQRFIETLQSLHRSRWLDRLRHHHPHQPTRAFAEDFIRVSTLLLTYVSRHKLLPESSSSSSSSSRMRRQSQRSSGEGVHVRRVHRETLFAMLVRLHQYIDTLRRIVRHGRQRQQAEVEGENHQLLSAENHRHCIDVLHAFTNFHVNARR